MNSRSILQAVRSHADFMLAHGRGLAHEPPIPLFGAVVDPLAAKVLEHQLPPPPGIRFGDFSWAGNNLMHDIPLLETLIALTTLTGDGCYEAAVDQALTFYAGNCPWPGTGLFPWGEHAQWSFHSRRALPNSTYTDPFDFLATNAIIHDHLRFAPGWFWRRLWAADADVVRRYCRGLNRHLMNHDTFEHNRHAPLTEYTWNELPYAGQGKDFARHAGFFIFECAFAASDSADPYFADWAERKIAYQLGRRLASGILRGAIRSAGEEREGQHEAFAACLADAAALYGADDPRRRRYATAADELFAARHAVGWSDEIDPEVWLQQAWYHGYGDRGSPWGTAALLAQALARAPHAVYAHRLMQIAELQLQVAPPPRDRAVLAWAFVNNLVPLLSGYELSGDRRFLQRAAEVAGWAQERLVVNGLFTAAANFAYQYATNVAWSPDESAAGSRRLYLSGCGVPSLVRNLLRLSLLLADAEDVLGVDPHLR